MSYILIHDGHPETPHLVSSLDGYEGPEWTNLGEFTGDPETHVWNAQTLQMEFHLDRLKRALRDRVNARKLEAEIAGTTCQYGPLDTTEASQRKITGLLVKASMFPANFSTKWTLANDVDLTIDASMAAVIGLAIGDHVSTCHDVSRELKAQIAAATSVEELDGIDIEGADWP